MKRIARSVSCAALLAAVSLVAVPFLLAEPSARPRPEDEPHRMELPAGRYSSLVFAYSGSTTGASLRVRIPVATDGEGATLLIPPGETLILPVQWNLARPLVVEFDQATRVFASGVSAEGPVTFTPVER